MSGGGEVRLTQEPIPGGGSHPFQTYQPPRPPRPEQSLEEWIKATREAPPDANDRAAHDPRNQPTAELTFDPARQQLFAHALDSGEVDLHGAWLKGVQLPEKPGVVESLLQGFAHAGKAILDAPIKMASGMLDLSDRISGNDAPHHNPLEGVDSLSLIPGEERRRRTRETLAGTPGVARVAGQAGGTLLTFLAGGGAAGAVGKAAGTPGKLVETLGFPGAALGAKLISKLPEVGLWSKLARGIVPGTIASSTGFGLSNLITSEGGMEERAAAMLHGMGVGAALHVAGEAGRFLDSKILGKLLTEGEAKEYQAVLAGLKDPSTLSVGMLKRLPGRTLSSAIEATPFAGMDEGWWGNLMAGGERREQAIAAWAASFFGVLFAKTGQKDAYLHFRRTDPDLNTWENYWQAEQLKGQAKAGAAAEVKAADEAAGAAYREHVAEQSTTMQAATSGVRRAGMGTEPVTDHNAAMLTPLMQAGWWPKNVTPNEVTLDFPGSDVVVTADGTVRLGDKEAHGPEAALAIQALVLRSLEARLHGEMVFGSRGFHESSAGRDGWSSDSGRAFEGDDGFAFAIGLDGKVYRQSVPRGTDEPWEAWTAPGLTDSNGRPILPSDGPLAANEQVQRWTGLVRAMEESVAPSPGLDVLRAAVELLARGNPDSPSVQQLQDLLTTELEPGKLNADLFEPILTVQNLPQIANEIGKVGAGTSNAVQARARIGAAMAPPKAPAAAGEKPGERAPEVGTPNRDKNPSGKEAGVLGLDVDTAKIARGVVAVRRFGSKYPTLIAEELQRRVPESSMPREAQRAFSRRRGFHGEARVPHQAVERTVTGETREYLDTFVPEHPEFGFESTRLSRLIENRGVEGAVPERAAEGVQHFRDLESTLWRQAVQAGDVRPDRQTGQVERMTEVVDPGRLPRMMGPDAETILNDPALRNRLAEGMARVNGIDRKVVDEWLEPMWREGTPRPDREAAFNKLRTVKYVPGAMTVDGRRLEFLEGKTIEAADRLLHSQTAHSGIVSVFGPDLSKSDAKRLGETRPGVQGALKEFAKVADADTRKLADVMMTRLAGGGGEQPLLTPWGGKVPQGILSLESARRAAETILAGVQDIIDPAVAYGAYGGWARLVHSLREAGVPGSEAFRTSLQEADRFGSVMQETGQYSFSEARGSMAKLRDLLSLFSRSSEKWKQVVGDRMAARIVEDMRAGRADAGVALDLDLTGFSREEQAAMLRGEGGENYDEFRRRFVTQATGNFLPGEGSALHANRSFNFWLAYQKFFMSRMRQVLRLAPRAFSGPNKLEATKRLLGVMFGAAVAGQFGSFISFAIASGTNAPERWWKELSSAPVWTILKQGGLQLVGGALAQGIQTVARAFETGETANVVSTLTAPGRVLGQIVDQGLKVVRGEEDLGSALMKTADRVGLHPEMQAAQGLLALAGSQQDRIQSAVRDAYRWARREGLVSTPQDRPTPFDRVQFNVAMEHVQQAMRYAVSEGKDPFTSPGLDKAMREALGVNTGAAIAQSLQGRRILGNQLRLDAKQRESLTEFMGDERMRLLYQYDHALDLVAAHYRRQAGTKPPQENFDDRLRLTRGQAALGDHSLMKNLVDEVADSSAAAVVAGGKVDRETIGRVAAAVADYPDTWQGVFTGDVQRRALKHTKEGLRTIEAMMLRQVQERVEEIRRGKLQDMRKTER